MTAKSRELFPQKSFIIDVWQGFEYAFEMYCQIKSLAEKVKISSYDRGIGPKFDEGNDFVEVNFA